jgi:hypothetical protein
MDAPRSNGVGWRAKLYRNYSAGNYRFAASNTIENYAAFFFEALTLAHRARCAAAIFLRAEADIVRLFFGAATAAFFVCPFFPFSFAHRAF